MKIKVSEIPEEGLTLSEGLDPEDLDLNTAEVRFRSPVGVQAVFQKERETVWVEVRVSGETEQVCARCLGVSSKPYGEAFPLDYAVRELQELDITDDVRQEIAVRIPLRVLCREDCRGLCAACGANRNERSCAHGSA